MYKKIKKATDQLEWLEQRRTLGIGGSECAPAIGLSTPYNSRMKLWVNKRGISKPEDLSSLERIEWGLRAEDMIAQAFKDKHPECKIKKNNFILQSAEHSFMIADLDREGVDEQGRKFVLEIKNVSEYMQKEWRDEDIPVSYELQVLHYLIVTGYEYGYIVALIGGNKYIEKMITIDDSVKQTIIEGEREFWTMVQENEMPEPDGSDADGETIEFLYQAEEGKIIELPDDVDFLTRQYLQLSEQIKMYEKGKEECKQRLQMKLKDAEKGETNNFVISWKQYVTQRSDSKLIQSKYPDIYQESLKETTARRFTIKEKK